MAKTKKKRAKIQNKKVGLAPGSMVYTGKKAEQKLFIESFNYNKESYQEKELKNVEEAFGFKISSPISWINLNGLSHVTEIEKIGNHYGIHPLVLEDIVNTAQRPKIDEYGDYLFIVLKMLYYDDNETIVSEQVSLILGKSYVITFQEAEGDVFNTVRDRIRHGRGRIRSMEADYLLYALLDAIIDHYFIIIETLGNKIEDLESDVFNGIQDDNITKQIQDLKREILRVRRAIYPLREVISRIERHESSLIKEKTMTFFRDIYDHIIQVSENIDIYREMVWSLMDMYMTTISNKMNEVMKVLTIMASIFIPLTFIAGVYGMNFEYIPELKYKYSYFIIWGIFVAMVIAMIIYFRRKRWL
ncbi:MAG: magnesium/cobalt transporter CorA [Flavobacteriaceae bacterium]